MPILNILDGFCFDCGHYMGVSCPRCTNAKPQESAEDGHGRIYGLVEIYQSSLAPATSR